MPEKVWLTLHVRKDYEERADVVRALGTLINPGAFMSDPHAPAIHSSTEISDEIAEKTGLDEDEIQRIMTEDVADMDEYDVIEKVA